MLISFWKHASASIFQRFILNTCAMEELLISWFKKPITLINVNPTKPVTLMVKCVHEGSSRLLYHHSRLNVTSFWRKRAEVILLSPLNYSPFLNIIKYWSQRNLFLMEVYLRTCSSAIRSIGHNPKCINLWKYVKLHLLSSLGILFIHKESDTLFSHTFRCNVNTKKKTPATSKCFSNSNCRTRLVFRSDFYSINIRILEVSLWVAAKENRCSKQSWEICCFSLHQ